MLSASGHGRSTSRGITTIKKVFGKYNNHPHAIRGQPDITGILPGGRALFIEVKSAKGKLSDHQEHFIEWIKDSGALMIVARSLEEVQDDLRESGYTFNF